MQELRNASYHGPFVNLARKEFSNAGNANMNRWLTYVKGDPRRQAVLERALDWVSDGNIDDYMAQNRYKDNITELKNHFETVIDWIDSIFDYTGSEMCGLEWGRLYKEYHTNAYSKNAISDRMNDLFGDPQVTNKKGVIEYILSGESKPELLNVRVFDENTKRTVYAQQTNKAKVEGVSNCPLCALGTDNNHARIYKINEMDADHVAAWSKGGSTDISNCTMLCKTHNRAKGNK
jgi:hypothetical protein